MCKPKKIKLSTKNIQVVIVRQISRELFSKKTCRVPGGREQHNIIVGSVLFFYTW